MKPMEKLSLIESGRAKVNKPDEQYKARKREFGKRRENEFRRFDEYIDSLPKTWWAYVEARRLDRRMIGADDPYPELPDPLPRDYPKPIDWPAENVSADSGKEPRHYDFEGYKERRDQGIIPLSEINKQSTKTVRHNIDDLIDNVFDTKD